MTQEGCRKKLMIYPDDAWKGNWDLFITTILILTCNSTPYMISFDDSKSVTWKIIDIVVDVCFLIDILFNFTSAFYNEDFIIQ